MKNLLVICLTISTFISCKKRIQDPVVPSTESSSANRLQPKKVQIISKTPSLNSDKEFSYYPDGKVRLIEEFRLKSGSAEREKVSERSYEYEYGELSKLTTQLFNLHFVESDTSQNVLMTEWFLYENKALKTYIRNIDNGADVLYKYTYANGMADYILRQEGGQTVDSLDVFADDVLEGKNVAIQGYYGKGKEVVSQGASPDPALHGYASFDYYYKSFTVGPSYVYSGGAPGGGKQTNYGTLRNPFQREVWDQILALDASSYPYESVFQTVRPPYFYLSSYLQEYEYTFDAQHHLINVTVKNLDKYTQVPSIGSTIFLTY